MEIPKSFRPDKSLKGTMKRLLSEGISLPSDDTKLYNYIKKVYEGDEERNVVVLYGDFLTDRYESSIEIKERLSKEYDLHHTMIFPVDTQGSLDFIFNRQNEIFNEYNKGMKIYVDIVAPDKLNVMTQRHLITILAEYQFRKNIVFVLHSHVNLMKVDSEVFTYEDKVYRRRGMTPLINGLEEQILKQGITFEVCQP